MTGICITVFLLRFDKLNISKTRKRGKMTVTALETNARRRTSSFQVSMGGGGGIARA
jgi:hypothetical protein